MAETIATSEIVVVGSSRENFAAAAEDAIREAARTIRGIREGEVLSLKALVEEDRPLEYRVTVSLRVAD